MVYVTLCGSTPRSRRAKLRRPRTIGKVALLSRALASGMLGLQFDAWSAGRPQSERRTHTGPHPAACRALCARSGGPTGHVHRPLPGAPPPGLHPGHHRPHGLLHPGHHRGVWLPRVGQHSEAPPGPQGQVRAGYREPHIFNGPVYRHDLTTVHKKRAPTEHVRWLFRVHTVSGHGCGAP